MLDIAFKSAVDLAADIRAKKVGCLEVLEHFWQRAERYNRPLNAIIFADMERARARAGKADAAVARGEFWGALHGVPMTIKESYDVVGMPTTWGVMALKDNFPATNAVTVDRLLAAGVTIYGKTNVPAMLGDWQTFNPIYGTTNNPWELSLSPGGSSGGAAAALATGLTPLEAGSDIGASIRNPAHYCGVFGHKPTYGIVPLRGQLYPGNVAPIDLFVSGPMARSAADLAVALPILAGPDILDAPGWTLNLPQPTRRSLADCKVAVMYEDPNTEVDVEVKDLLHRLVEFLVRHGVKVSETARPVIDSHEAHAIYIRLLRAATSRAQTPEAFQRNLEILKTLSPEDDRYYARMIRGNTQHHMQWLDTDEIRHRMRYKWLEFFNDYDFMLCPVASSAAQPHDFSGERYQRTVTINGRKVSTMDQLFWAGISTLPGLPGTAAPIGLTPRGLPVGVQIIGSGYSDLACIAFAGWIEKEYYAFVRPPGYED